MEAAADYYATLRVEPGAEAAAIRLAYRDLMRRYHPDVNASDEAAAKAKAINEAYACLRDPVERAAYDRRRNPRPMGSAFGAPPPPRHAPRPGWRPQHAYIVDEEQEPQPRKWKVASLGLAALLTVITFTITSAIPPAIMPAPEPAMVLQMEGGRQVLRKAEDLNCETPGTGDSAPCRMNPGKEPQAQAR